MKVTRILSVVLLASMILAACASKASSASSLGLAQANHLLVCTDFPYPPQEFFDANGDPQGLDVEMAQTELAS